MLSLNHRDPGVQTQFIRLGGRRLCRRLMSNLSSSCLSLSSAGLQTDITALSIYSLCSYSRLPTVLNLTFSRLTHPAFFPWGFLGFFDLLRQCSTQAQADVELTHYVAKNDIGCWDYRCRYVTPQPSLLVTKPRTLCNPQQVPCQLSHIPSWELPH